MRLFYCRVTALLMVLCAAGCGFSLRQAPLLPADLAGISVTAPSAQSRLARAIGERLSVYQIPLVETNSEAVNKAIQLNLSPESFERRLLSIFPTGQVAEYELIYSVRYTIQFPGQPAKDSYIEILREYQDDPSQVLAKARELELIVSEMRAETADRIIRRLPSQGQLD